MKIFISGATGFIGSRLAIRLADEGNTIHALYRSKDKAAVLNHPGIVLFKGDILDIATIDAAIKGCEQVYHTAAFTRVWDPDQSRIYRLNIEGTMNVIHAGINAGIKKFVCTSTAGVYGPSGINAVVNEKSQKPSSYFIDYESSKAILEKILHTLSNAGINIVIVNPTRVFGPGILSQSNGVTRMIKKYSEGRWRFIPGDGKSHGNYVFVEDVVNGHILAMTKGVSGENYLLGGDNVSYNDFFNQLSELLYKKYSMIHIPLWVMLLSSHCILLFAKITSREPLITPPLVKKFLHEWNVSSDKAKNDLGYSPLSITKGLKKTLEWINTLS